MKKISKQKKPSKKEFLFSEIKHDLKGDAAMEGLVLRPALLMSAFLTFIGAMFLMLIGNLKWGGSLLIFSFVLNLYSIYQSFCDNDSIFRTLNLFFKIVLLVGEILAFNWILVML